jgi:urease accessory protein
MSIRTSMTAPTAMIIENPAIQAADGGCTADQIDIASILEFGDSMLPVGAFSFSGRLESAIQQGVVIDVPTLREFVMTAVEQAATADGIGVIAAHRAAAADQLERVADIDQVMFNRKLSDETRNMTTRMGKKLVELGAQVTRTAMLTAWLEKIRNGATPGTYPAGLAVLFASLGLAERAVFIVHQYGVATTILGASLRLLRVDHMDTQRILFEINAQAAIMYERAAAARLEDMAAYAPVYDILAAVHARAQVRLFMN